MERKQLLTKTFIDDDAEDKLIRLNHILLDQSCYCLKKRILEEFTNMHLLSFDQIKLKRPSMKKKEDQR